MASSPPLSGPAGVVSDIVGWWKADELAGADASEVTSLPDSSGQGRTLTRPATWTGPSLQTAEINGLNVIQGGNANNTGLAFDKGATDLLTGTQLEVFMVVKRIGNGQANGRVVSFDNASAADYNSADSAIPLYEWFGSWRGHRNTVDLTTVTAVTGTAILIGSRWDTTNYTMRRDGADETPVASAGTFASRRLYVTNSASGLESPSVAIGELIVYNRALNSTERGNVESYLQTKWGTPGGPASLNRSATDSIDLAETLTRAVALPRAITESVTLAESLARAASHPRSVAETITIAESLARLVAYPRAVAESITIGESLARTATHPRALTESITLAESLARVVSDSRFPADGIVLSDSAAGTANPGRMVSDSIVLTESLTRGAFTPARAATDAATLSDAVARTSLRNRSATDSATLSDTATGTVAPATSLNRSATDSLSLTDTATRTLIEARNVSDSIVLGDTAVGGAPGSLGYYGSTLPLLFVGGSRARETPPEEGPLTIPFTIPATLHGSGPADESPTIPFTIPVTI